MILPAPESLPKGGSSVSDREHQDGNTVAQLSQEGFRQGR